MKLFALTLAALSSASVLMAAPNDIPPQVPFGKLPANETKKPVRETYEATIKYSSFDIGQASVGVSGPGSYAKGSVSGTITAITLKSFMEHVQHYDRNLNANQREYMEKIQAGGGLSTFWSFLGLSASASYSKETGEMHVDLSDIFNSDDKQGLDLTKWEQTFNYNVDFWVQGDLYGDVAQCYVQAARIQIQMGDKKIEVISPSASDVRINSNTKALVDGIHLKPK
jgi:hypothetical protein